MYYYSIVRICHNLFIHSSVDEHLNAFQFGPIGNKAATSIVFYGPVLPSLVVMYLGIELLGHREGGWLTLQKLVSLFVI